MADVSSVNLPRGASSFARYEQTFPTLTPHEIDRMRRFGEVRRFGDGEALFETGKPGPGMFVMLSGNVVISHRDGLGHVAHIIDQGPGQFMAEIGQLSGRVALVDGHADGDVETLLIAPDNLRALLVAEADLGERIMRALILRRVRLIQEGVGGAVLIGSEALGDMTRLQNFLARNGQPHHVLDPAVDTDAADLVARYAGSRGDLPLVVCPDGTVLANPSENELAYALGMIGIHAHDKLYDVAVVGGGPAGLSTAVYAASEGLSVAVLDARAYGGQAGASMRIENYLGFPTGISGQALAGRAFTQAQKFGAEIWIPVTAKSLDCAHGDGMFALQTECGQLLRARSVVVASGARYRRPEIENLAAFEGRGVWYWASPIEAKLCAGQEIALVGAGNSAGQAVVYLASQGVKVWMLVRRRLEATMSRYLVDRIRGLPNVEVVTGASVSAVEGRDGVLEAVRWRVGATGEETRRPIKHLFLFIGADPNTDWLAGSGVALDAKGFVRTGEHGGADRHPLETTRRGVFAIGDVRTNSVKRVAAAVGEGAQVVAALHAYLADASADAAVPRAVSLQSH